LTTSRELDLSCTFPARTWTQNFCDSINQFKTQAGHNTTESHDVINFDSLTTSDFVDSDKLQRKLYGQVEKHQIILHKIHTDNQHREYQARMHSVSGKHSGAWLRTLHKQSFTMDSAVFAVSCQLRLGMQFPFIPESMHCDCNSRAVVGTRGEHLHACAKGGEWNSRHYKLVNVIRVLSGTAKVHTIHEPIGCFVNTTDTNMRPDVRLIRPQLNNQCVHDVVLDISVTHPSNKSCLTKGSDVHVGGAAKIREDSKNNQYNKIAKSNSLHFIPCVAETYGRLGNQFIRLIDDLVKAAFENNNNSNISYSLLSEYWTKRISCALQISNARLLLNRTARIAGGSVLHNDEARFPDTILYSKVYGA
jgi:hypothetical protein